MRRAALVLMALLMSADVAATAPDRIERQDIYDRCRAGECGALRKLAETGDVGAVEQLSRALYKRGYREEALAWRRRAAEQGSTAAMSTLAMWHRFADEHEQAAYWTRRGAEAGASQARIAYAHLLTEGKNLARDEAEALRQLSLAAEAGYRYAYPPLAEFYAKGVGTARDPLRALALTIVADAVLTYSDTFSHDQVERVRRSVFYQLTAAERAEAERLALKIRPDLPKIEAHKKRKLLALLSLLAGVAVLLLALLLAAVYAAYRIARCLFGGALGMMARRTLPPE